MLALFIVALAVVELAALGLVWTWGSGAGYRSGFEDGYRVGRDHREIV